MTTKWRQEDLLNDDGFVALVVFLIIFGGVAMLWMAVSSRRRIREMEHRERLAMIERGLAPAPEADPAGFERRTGLARRPQPPQAARSRSAGVILIGFGLGLAVLIAFAAGEPGVGLGIGGGFALLGAAFVVNGMLMSRDAPPSAITAQPPRRDVNEPPSNLGSA
jgi:uncharacterized protein DUF6249